MLSGSRAVEPLKCFSCGKLGSHDCEAFDVTDPKQAKICKKDEVCLIYSWEKTPHERGNDKAQYSHNYKYLIKNEFSK